VVSESACKRKIVPVQIMKGAMCHLLLNSDLPGGEYFSMNDHTQE